jgi:hypothetical protein
MYGDLMDTIGFVGSYDPEVGEAMNKELKRQQRNLELIASENLVSPAVMAAMGSVLTNKYAEGYPQKNIMVDANALILLKQLLLKERKSFLAQDMQTFRLIQVLRQILQYTLLF